MGPTRIRIVRLLDRALTLSIPTLIFGSALAFGGVVWWGRIFSVGLTFLIGLAWFLRCGFSGRWPVLWSPLTLLGAMAICLGIAQLFPWPGSLAASFSPQARSAHSLGVLPEVARLDDPSVEFPPPFTTRSPLTLDRAATLRWVVGASACLAIFWISSHFANRLGRLSTVWGAVIAAFVLNGAFAVVQLSGGADGLYGFIQPGAGPKWAPSSSDAYDSPGRMVFRTVSTGGDSSRSWAFSRPLPVPLVGTMPGGVNAFLALGSLAFPMGLALTLQLMAPRGSREPLWSRLSQSGSGSLLILLYGATIVNACLIGLFAGRLVALPFLAAVVLIGIPSLFGTGLRLKGFILTTLTLASLGGGVALNETWAKLLPSTPQPPHVDLTVARQAWSSALPILRDFPLVGVGMGAYGSVAPYYKSTDAVTTSAESTLAQWATESGIVGLAILALALFWGLVRLPVAIARVGSADRALAFGFVGTIVCFLSFATFRWSVELPAVAIAASVFAGTLNRWLAGGTDLLVEPTDA